MQEQSTESKIAWAAGLFEGEGCISLVKGHRTSSNRTRDWVKLAILMTDRDVLVQFHEVVGTGGVSFHHRPERPESKDCWSWQAGARKDVERILLAFLPWFGERRTAKALAALQLIRELRAKRPCEFCGSMFEPYRERQRFCSSEHRMRAHYINRRPKEVSRVGRPRTLPDVASGIPTS